MVQTNYVFEIHSTFFHTWNDILHDFQGAAHPTPKVATALLVLTSGESGATALLVLTLREREHI
jgi:hypothetical protein